MVDISEYQLPFASGISRHDDAVATLKQSFDDVQLAHYAGVVLVFLPLTLLAGDERELGWQYGQVLLPETGKPVGFGHGQPDQMPESPCYGTAVAFQIPVLPLSCSYDCRDALRHRRLFCDDDILHIHLYIIGK